MKARVLPLLASLAILASACTPPQKANDPPSTTHAAEGGTSSSSIPGASTTSGVEPIPARLVINDPSGAVVITDEEGTTVERIDPPADAIFTQPIWTATDTIVYSQAADDDNRLEAHRVGEGSIWSVGLATHPFFYLADPDSAVPTVLSLRNNTDRPGLITERISGPDSIAIVSEESPFYASWSPIDARFASHVQDERIDITGTATETISTSAEGFQAPVWLTSGLITLRNDGGETLLSQWSDGTFADIAKVSLPARFVASGNLIAILTGGAAVGNGVQTSVQSLPTIPAGVLTVIDIESESFTTVMREPSPIFQWSPEADRLLYATFVNDPAPAVAWHVWENGNVTDYQPFIPEGSWSGILVPFFDQYAQSVSLWSPDGTAFAYPASVAGSDRILVQHVSEAGPRDIAAGTWVAWSPRG